MVTNITEQNNSSNPILIFPNPTSGNLNIYFSSIEDDIFIFVYDAIGKLIFKKTENFTEHSKNIKLSLQHLSEGLYHIQLTTSTENYYSNFNIIK